MQNFELHWTPFHFNSYIFFCFFCFSFSACASIVGIPVGTTSSGFGLKTCVITARIEKYNYNNRKETWKIIFLAKANWNSIEFLIYEALIDSYISYEFVSINKVLKWYNETKEKKS